MSCHVAPHLLYIVQSVFDPIPKHPVAVQAVGVHSEIQVIDQLRSCGQRSRGIMPH